jgi:hypothetical protein
VQRQPLADFRPYRMSGIVNMSDADAQTRFVQDITGLQAATWRWTGKRPTVRVMTRSTENLKYTIDFAIVEATLATTGPVTVTFLVNDRVLDRAPTGGALRRAVRRLLPRPGLEPAPPLGHQRLLFESLGRPG